MAGFVAVWFNKLSVDRVKLLQGLAILQLFVTAVNIVTGRGVGDKVTSIWKSLVEQEESKRTAGALMS